jgi:hypothetical protein
MSGRPIIGWILVGAGLALAAASAVFYARTNAEASSHLARIAVLEDSLDAIREEAVRNNLLHRGLEMSIQQLPESVRVYGGGKILEQSKEYSKKSHILNVRDRNVRIVINAARRKADRARDRAVTASAPVAIGGLVMLVAGLIVLRTSGGLGKRA